MEIPDFMICGEIPDMVLERKMQALEEAAKISVITQNSLYFYILIVMERQCDE